MPRPQLTGRLRRGWQSGHRLTLISAPAGFGKTTLLCEWINMADFPVAWLSLEAADDDPVRFFTYFINALRQLAVDLGQDILDVLHAGQLPPADVMATTLINEIMELEQRFLLALDDFHLIQDRLILQVMDQVLANHPPPLHLALVTREDPPLSLARLRASNYLTEIRARELCFDSRKTASFLNDVLDLSLSKADIGRLQEKTEGWPAGLQLAAISLRDQDDPSALIAALSGSHRLIMNYLTEQVLEQQPPEIRHFLLKTAVLHRLNGDLCNAVSGRSDGHTLLESLYNANVFLVALDDKREWYRYHHLFVDLLRDQQLTLPQEEKTLSNQRASRWYEQKGMVDEAIEHALAARDFARAVDLLENQALDLLMKGHAKRVNGWMQQIPQEWRSQSLKTYLALAWSYLLRGDYSQAAPYMHQLQRALDNDVSASVQGDDKVALKAEWMVLQSLLLFMDGEVELSQDRAAQALEIAPLGEVRVRSLAHYTLASVYQLNDAFDLATEHFQTAARLGRSAKNLVAELMSVIGLAVMAFEQGRLHLALEIVSPVIIRVEKSSFLPPISAVLYGVKGEIYYQWHQTQEARQQFERALQLNILGGINSGTIISHILLSRLDQLSGDLQSAARQIKMSVSQMQDRVPDYVRQEVAAQQVRLQMALSRPAAAEAILQQLGFSFQGALSFPEFPGERNITYSQGLLYNSALLVLLEKARVGKVDINKCKALADQLVDGAFKAQQQIIALEALLMRAQMKAQLGNEHGPASARSDLIRALQVGEQEGIVTVFVERGSAMAEVLTELVAEKRLEGFDKAYIQRILDAFSATATPTAKLIIGDEHAGTLTVDRVDPLTERETAVLMLIAEGLKYKEIAERLFISINTVRYHIKTIYGKLQVNNRAQAIQKARRMRLL